MDTNPYYVEGVEWSAGTDMEVNSMVLLQISSSLSLGSTAGAGLQVAGASCNIPPDHDDGCGSPEPDLSAPHHLPEMDTDIPR